MQIADTFILKQDCGKQAFSVRNLLIWLLGFIAYRLLMRVDLICGNTLPDMVITILLCVVCAKLEGKKQAGSVG